MKLVYYRKTIPNFGDDLNTRLWPVLEPALFDADPAHGFVGIGTIIGMPIDPALTRLTVFSSGMGNDPIDAWSNRTVDHACVRGPISARLLNLPERAGLTDGAILTPLAPAFPSRAGAGKGTLLIPHWETLGHPGWDEVAAATGFEVVDPRGTPEDVIGRIADAKLVITESLHGAILADVYGIPWIAFATSRNFSVTKWVDWTLSVGLPFELTLVPPPDAGPVLAFGRRPEPLGTLLRFDAEDAIVEVEQRLAPAGPAPKLSVKAMLKKSKWIRPFLGYSPARTAEALLKVAKTTPMLSDEGRRTALQSEMRDRLAALNRR